MTDKNFNFALILLLILLLGLFIIFSIYSRGQDTKLRLTQAQLEYYQKIILTRQGSSAGYGNYYLLSVDGGYHWHNVVVSAVGFEIDGRRRYGWEILGPADTNLVKHLEAMDALTVYAESHQTNTDVLIRLLEDAGFQVKTNANSH